VPQGQPNKSSGSVRAPHGIGIPAGLVMGRLFFLAQADLPFPAVAIVYH
jgi:hypothetical protein